MASEWIKWTKGLCRKPEVVTLSSRFERDRFSIAARLMCVWEWTDEVTNDGAVPGVSLDFIDELAGIKGFGEGMIAVGWLSLMGDGVEFTNYIANNGNTGKSRAQAQKRQNVSRLKRDKSVTESVTREEKRREEINTPLTPLKGGERKRRPSRNDRLAEQVNKLSKIGDTNEPK
jgi:hypothetical protein